MKGKISACNIIFSPNRAQSQTTTGGADVLTNGSSSPRQFQIPQSIFLLACFVNLIRIDALIMIPPSVLSVHIANINKRDKASKKGINA
jgi:hypothetical protein